MIVSRDTIVELASKRLAVEEILLFVLFPFEILSEMSLLVSFFVLVSFFLSSELNIDQIVDQLSTNENAKVSHNPEISILSPPSRTRKIIPIQRHKTKKCNLYNRLFITFLV